MNAVRATAKALLATADTFLPMRTGPRILIYHQIGSGRTHEMNVDAKAFRNQVEWMQSKGEIVSLEDGIRRRGEADANQLFVLTFDDGYADVYRNAYPFLTKARIPFTLYITTGPIETPRDHPEWPGEPLSWRQIQEMLESELVTVGAHTHSHPDLRNLTRKAVARELDKSNSLIAERTTIEPKHFTYPKGWWSALAHEEVRDRYQSATLGSGPAIGGSSDPFKLHRLPVQRSDYSPLFRHKMRRGALMEDRLRRRWRNYRGP